jgi:hypothetical protein
MQLLRRIRKLEMIWCEWAREAHSKAIGEALAAMSEQDLRTLRTVTIHFMEGGSEQTLTTEQLAASNRYQAALRDVTPKNKGLVATSKLVSLNLRGR